MQIARSPVRARLQSRRRAAHRAGADGADIVIAGGAGAARQFLAVGLLEQLTVHLVPGLLGAGVHLFDDAALAGSGLRQSAVIEAPGVTYLTYHLAP
jgi:dihydrofolate reductase